ncbi:radical SAM protein [Clostridium perfringens]|uniref:radical SAM protein n=1 Tax=Clostridium perfringens TaxID=1502 RepID=UPI0018E4B703|nr:radical SAM protein [Clostridium perfringens]MBI6106035.1 radical SAM protein [Clostridium perfringens]
MLGNEILNINVIPTNDCNFNCIYCFQKHEKGTTISNDVEENILKYLNNNLHKFKKLYINWFGGEPLTIKEKIISLNKRIKNICREKKVSYLGRITTNGYELDLNTFKNLFKNNVLIYYISIDGSEQFHNRQRPLKNGGETYRRIIENLLDIKNNIKSNVFKIEIRVNISKSNLKDMENFLKEYRDLFSNDSRFRLVLDKVNEWGEKVSEIKDELINYKDIIKWADIAQEYGIKMSNLTVDNLETEICQAPQKNGFIIMYDGTVRKCQMAMVSDTDKNIDLIGKINKDGELIKNKNEQLWVKPNLSKQCEYCVALPLCLGSKCVYNKFIKGENCTNVRDNLINYLQLMDESNLNNIDIIEVELNV